MLADIQKSVQLWRKTELANFSRIDKWQVSYVPNRDYVLE